MNTNDLPGALLPAKQMLDIYFQKAALAGFIIQSSLAAIILELDVDKVRQISPVKYHSSSSTSQVSPAKYHQSSTTSQVSQVKYH